MLLTRLILDFFIFIWKKQTSKQLSGQLNRARSEIIWPVNSTPQAAQGGKCTGRQGLHATHIEQESTL